MWWENFNFHLKDHQKLCAYVESYVPSCPTFSRTLCALRALFRYVPHVLRALVTCVLLCPFCLVLLCPICLVPRALRALRLCALVPHLPRALHVPVLHEPHSLHALVLHMLCASRTCDLCGLMPRALFPYIPYCLIPCILYILLSPFVLLSSHASRSYFCVYLLLVIFFGSLLKLEQK